ncbi:MAG: carboxypeptidase-like regulatory domain-containing protein [Gemmatimonadaceae bacterium]
MALALWVTSAGAWGQDPRAIILFGTVRNTIGVALSGVEVWLDGSRVHAVTSDSGGFQFSAAPSGRVTVMARYAGFHPASKRVTLRPGDTKQVDLTLEGIPDALDTVLVTARLDSAVRLREFWARRTIGIGIFMTRADIERRRAPSARCSTTWTGSSCRRTCFPLTNSRPTRSKRSRSSAGRPRCRRSSGRPTWTAASW